MTTTKSAVSCRTMLGGVLFITLLTSASGIPRINVSGWEHADEIKLQSNTADIYKYTSPYGINFSISTYNRYESIYSEMENVIIDDEKMYNLKKMDEISALEVNWNGNGACEFSSELIARARGIITALERQPELFPLPGNSIQLEYEKIDGTYLEIQLTQGAIWSVFQINENEEEVYSTIPAEVDAINKVVTSFYG